MRYLITPTLLNSWSYYMGVDEEWAESARASFLQTLSRDKFEPTEDMEKGNKFERDVFAYVDGYRPQLTNEHLNPVDIIDIDDGYRPFPDGDYWSCVADLARHVHGGVRQLAVKAEIEVGGQAFLLYGKVDHLAGPWATDIKFTGNYEFPKYKETAQHSVYLHCLPAVPSFRYLISDGRRTYEEVYQRVECRPVADMVAEFMAGISRWDEAAKMFTERWQALG